MFCPVVNARSGIYSAFEIFEIYGRSELPLEVEGLLSYVGCKVELYLGLLDTVVEFEEEGTLSVKPARGFDQLHGLILILG